MTKSLVAISNHADLLGGGEHSFIELLSHLPPPWRPVVVISRPGEVGKRIESERVNFTIIPLPSVRPWNIIHIIHSIQSLIRLCLNTGARLIYSNGSRSALYGGLAGRILDVPVIWHCRVADADSLMDFFLSSLITRIIANSRATAKRFHRNVRGKVKVVHNGVDLEWLRQEPLPKPSLVQHDWKVILVVARASRWKRHDIVLSAFDQMAASNPFVHLVFIGSPDKMDPNWWKYLQKKTRISCFYNRIHWVGPTGDIRPWYRAASVLVLSSENEPFGRVLVEAMACRVPIIAMGTGGVPEIVRDGQDGFLVQNVQEMTGAISKVLQNEKIRIELGNSGADRAESFSLDRHVKEMVRVFEETART